MVAKKTPVVGDGLGSGKDVVRKKRVRRKNNPKITSKTNVDISQVYCRRCQQTKKGTDFLSAVDKDIDKNGVLSVCKQCVNEMYDLYYDAEKSMEKAILRLCRKLNIKYDERAISALRTQLETMVSNGKTGTPPFGIYKAKLVNVQKVALGETKDDDLCYVDITAPITILENQLSDDSFEEAKDLIKFWSTSDIDDIEFLENEFANFKKTHKADSYAEIVLLKEVCYRLLDIKKARAMQSPTDTLIKGLQELMKNLAISPNMTNAANSGKNLDALGIWIAETEKEEPAQWLEGEGREMYHDVGNVEKYFQDYFVRPLRNFLLQTKNFNIDDEVDDNSSDGYDGIEEDISTEEVKDAHESSSISEK